jgi:GNAT superfamily N-acetyltransferase
MMEVRQLERSEHRRGREVLTEAFTDDPIWLAMGPDSRRLRRLVQRCWFAGALWCAARWGRPTRAAVRDGEVQGVAVVFDSASFPPPMRGVVVADAPMVLAGPRPIRRALKVEEAMKGSHPELPHLYLWLLAAHPDAQRQGVGRALLNDICAEADSRELPVYLETFTPANVPYYSGFGFRIDEEHPDVVRGATLWRMTRPTASG